MPASLNLTIKQGDTFNYTLTLTDGSGNPRDCTGNEYNAQIRKPGATPLSPSGIIYTEFDVDDTNANLGQIIFTLYPADSREIPSGIAWYDIQEIDPSTSPDTVLTLVQGEITVLPDVTLVEPVS